MKHIIKLTFLTVLIGISALLFVYWTDHETRYTLHARMTYALSSATKDATFRLRADETELAKNRNFDGNQRAPNDYEISRDAAMEVFMKTFIANINPRPKHDEEILANMIRGVAAYDGVMFVSSGDQWSALQPYAHYCTTNKTVYSFTLGELVYIRVDGGALQEKTLGSLISPYDFLSMDQLRDQVVMETISSRLNELAHYTETSRRLDTRVDYRLPGFDSSVLNGVTRYNEIGNVIRAPSVIAVYDYPYKGTDHLMRIASLAGSHLSLELE